MTKQYTINELEAYLDEALAPSEMATIENALRDNPTLVAQLTTAAGRSHADVHSLGAIWRRHRVSCPSREQLGSYLLGVLSDEFVAYIDFHLSTVGCRCCQANLEDLKRKQEENAQDAATRSRRYYQSSAGYLNKK